MIPDPRDEQITALTKERDFYVAKADYLQKTGIIQQMFRGISNALWVDMLLYDDWNCTNKTVNRNVWNRFLRSIRYLGGAANGINSDGTPGGELAQFITHIPNPPDNVYTVDETPASIPNPNAVFASFVGVNTFYNIKSMTDDNLLLGLRDVRDFISKHFPNIAYAMMHVGETDFFEPMNNMALPGTNIDGTEGVRFDLGAHISEILIRPFIELNSLSELGIADDPERKKALLEEIRAIRDSDGLKFIYTN
jgi:hypothetical protein